MGTWGDSLWESCDSKRLIRPISAVWAVTTSLAKTLASTSWPAPGDLKRSSTILSAPAWCLIMPLRKSRSKATPFASLIALSSSSVSMPSIRMSCQEAVSGVNCPYRRSHACMMTISGTCDWSIFRESLSTCGLAPFASAIRDITMAWAWWAIMPCMNSTSAFV